MTRLDRHLFVVVASVVLAAAIVHAPRREARVVVPPYVDDLPNTVGTWRGRAVVDDDVLPLDARSVDSVRRRYDGAAGPVWLGVARYPSGNAPELRPTLDALVPARGIRSMTQEAVQIPVPNGRTLHAIRRTVRYPIDTLTMWYWYQLGPRVVSDEYGLRLQLGMNKIRGQPLPLFLVRVATTGNIPSDFVAALLPHLDRLVAGADGNRS
jgi:EpsI family protein